MRFVPVLLLTLVSLRADVTLAPLFSNDAVLQHGKPLPVWGRADPGEGVRVEFAGQTVHTTADQSGRWYALLDPLQPAIEPAELVVTGKNTLRVTGVVVGEVWLCSGQSNMEWPLRLALNPEQEIAAARFPLVRHFKVKPRMAETPVEIAEGGWTACSPETAGDFTAVGYFFARDLHTRFGVPVGLINSTWGGTPIESWLSPATVNLNPTFRHVIDRWLDVLKRYPAAKEQYDHVLQLWTDQEKAAKAKGAKFEAPRPYPPEGPGHQNAPSSLFNGMINPLVPYAARGVLWYQGESNTGRAGEYQPLFRELITSWRRHFAQPDLFFLWAQLANHNGGDPIATNWAIVREAQTAALTLPDTGQAITIDIGDPNDYHPRNKQEVGRRMALVARAKLYGANIDYSGPVFSSLTREGAALRIRYEHAGTGLTARNKLLQSFQIAGADRTFYPAVARIDRDTVLVSATQVPEPVAVRYAWYNAPEANLYNGAGLPAVPFRSDDW